MRRRMKEAETFGRRVLVHMYTDAQLKRVTDFLRITDEEFYEKYVLGASLDEQMEFLEEFPEFTKIWKKLSGFV